MFSPVTSHVTLLNALAYPSSQAKKGQRGRAKVLLRGVSGSGGNSWLHQVKERRFLEKSNNFCPRNNDFVIKHMDSIHSLQIWSSYEERFRRITTSPYRGAKAIIILLDLSLEAMELGVQATRYRQQIDYHADKSACIYFVGTKVDLLPSIEDGIKKLKSVLHDTNIQYDDFFITSAKTGYGIHLCLEKVTKDLSDRLTLYSIGMFVDDYKEKYNNDAANRYQSYFIPSWVYKKSYMMQLIEERERYFREDQYLNYSCAIEENIEYEAKSLLEKRRLHQAYRSYKSKISVGKDLNFYVVFAHNGARTKAILNAAGAEVSNIVESGTFVRLKSTYMPFMAKWYNFLRCLKTAFPTIYKFDDLLKYIFLFAISDIALLPRVLINISNTQKSNHYEHHEMTTPMSVSKKYIDANFLDDQNRESEFVKSQSVFFVQQEEKIGPRFIKQWKLQDVEDKGNCFYQAMIKQMEMMNHSFLASIPTGTLPHDSLRLHVQGEQFEDKAWADIQEILQASREFNLVIAIIDTRHPSLGFRCYYSKENNEVAETYDPEQTPENLPILRLAFTGNHYLSVQSHPSLTLGAIRQGFIDPWLSFISSSANSNFWSRQMNKLSKEYYEKANYIISNKVCVS